MTMKTNRLLKFAILTSALGAALLPGRLLAQERPNILWIFIEDMNPLLSCYGDPLLKTPNFDRLAENGVLFEKCFVTAQPDFNINNTRL